MLTNAPTYFMPMLRLFYIIQYLFFPSHGIVLFSVSHYFFVSLLFGASVGHSYRPYILNLCFYANIYSEFFLLFSGISPEEYPDSSLSIVLIEMLLEKRRDYREL